MLKSLEQVSKDELRSLVDFSRALVVKAQEVADAAEIEALSRAGVSFTPVDRPARDWEQIVGYAVPGTTIIETRRETAWYHRVSGSEAAVFGIDVEYGIWQKFSETSWLNVATGQPRTTVDPSWSLLNVPAGETYIDAIRGRYLVPTLVWLDHTTGETSALGPGTGEFVGDPTVTGVYPDGLSDLIPTPQEYLTAKLRLATADLSPSEKAALVAAIESFEAPGLWEDTRQPYFAKDALGNIALDEYGLPQVNPLRVVEVKYRGELNDYYRQLVRDFDISPLASRSAEQFEVIDWSTTVTGLSSDDAKRFVAAHTESVRVFKAAFYNEAMEADSLYFRYCRMFIAWMTVIRMVNDRMEGSLDIDRMSNYELTNLLYSFGIYQFDDMPAVYKRRFAKSLEKMLADKGTTSVFKDILGIFNLDKDVKIWKHYLVRYFPDNNVVLEFPRLPVDGEMAEVVLGTAIAVRGVTMEELAGNMLSEGSFRTVIAKGRELICARAKDKPDVSISSVALIEADSGAILEFGEIKVGSTDYGLPEVGFQKVDMDDPTAEITVASTDAAYLSDYDEFVSRDSTWETSREDAKKMAFSVLQTKYFSIRSAVDTVYNGMAMALMWAMLKDAQARGRAGGMQLEGAATLNGVTSMNLFEAMVAALILTLWRFDVDDLIPHGEGGVSTIITARTDGAPFPGEGSLLPFSTKLERVADKPDPLLPQTIATMTDDNIDIALRMDIATNENVRYGAQGYDPVKGGEETRTVGRNTELRRMWDHKFVGKYQTEAFGAAERYSEWLDEMNPELAAWVRSVDESGDYVNGILSVVFLIEDAIESKTLNLPATMGMDDILMLYVERMVKFFKAYTTDLRAFSIFLLIDRPAVESLRLMNLMAGMRATWTREDQLEELDDLFASLVKMVNDEGKSGHLLHDLLGVLDVLGRFKEQDIAKFLDSAPSWAMDYIRVEPAAVMHDSATFRAVPAFGDALTMATRRQRDGDVAMAKLSDKEPAITEYDERRPWRSSPRHGLADGAIILTSD